MVPGLGDRARYIQDKVSIVRYPGIFNLSDDIFDQVVDCLQRPQPLTVYVVDLAMTLVS